MKKNTVALIENAFFLNAHYNLSEVQHKIMLFLASHINPYEDKFFYKQTFLATELIEFLWGDKTIGDPYTYLQEVIDDFLDRKIRFRKGAIIKGEKIKGGGINWFQSIVIKDTEAGVAIEFMFSERMEPFMLHLEEYARINAWEANKMVGKHTGHIFAILKTERQRTKRVKAVSMLTYGLPEFKAILGVKDQYKEIWNFRARVLDPAMKSINKCSSEISVRYEVLKSGRKASGVEFYISDKKKVLSLKKKEREDFTPSSELIDQLTHAKRKAYQIFVEFGVFEGIAYKQILPRIQGEVFEGFEDYCAELSVEHFKKKSKTPEDIRVFVSWWTKNGSYGVNSKDYGRLIDEVTVMKKKLEKTDEQAYLNRLEAKSMSYIDFVELHEKRKKQEEYS